MTKNIEKSISPEYQASVEDKHNLTIAAGNLLQNSSTETIIDDTGAVKNELHTNAGDGIDLTSITQEGTTRYKLTDWLGTRFMQFEWSNDPKDTSNTVTFSDERGLNTSPMNMLMFGNAQVALDSMAEHLAKPKRTSIKNRLAFLAIRKK
jgi:hypothetical protein